MPFYLLEDFARDIRLFLGEQGPGTRHMNLTLRFLVVACS